MNTKLNKLMKQKRNEIEAHKKDIEQATENFRAYVLESNRLSISLSMKKAETAQSLINKRNEQIRLTEADIDYMNHLSTAPIDWYEIELSNTHKNLEQVRQQLKSNEISQYNIIKNLRNIKDIITMVNSLKELSKPLFYEQATYLRRIDILLAFIDSQNIG